LFESRYPGIANEGRLLVALVKERGYDTPEKMRVLLKEIIHGYGLDDIISLDS
jgi:hypothetical protein